MREGLGYLPERDPPLAVWPAQRPIHGEEAIELPDPLPEVGLPLSELLLEPTEIGIGEGMARFRLGSSLIPGAGMPWAHVCDL